MMSWLAFRRIRRNLEVWTSYRQPAALIMSLTKNWTRHVIPSPFPRMTYFLHRKIIVKSAFLGATNRHWILGWNKNAWTSFEVYRAHVLVARLELASRLTKIPRFWMAVQVSSHYRARPSQKENVDTTTCPWMTIDDCLLIKAVKYVISIELTFAALDSHSTLYTELLGDEKVGLIYGAIFYVSFFGNC